MDSYEKSKIHTKRYKKIKALLKLVYDYDSFKPKQYEIINKIISGEDVCAVLPTGYGKSLTFQIPAIYLDKPAIVVSPLISLMDDQRMILDKLGISSCCFNGTVADKPQLKRDILECKYQFIYITPESVVTLGDFFKNLHQTKGVSLIAIDEAHCISSYGFDFRPKYRDLTMFRELMPDVPILAVTATATTMVGKDICKVLGFTNNKPIKTSFDRPNLFLNVRKKSNRFNSKNPGMDTDIVPIIREHMNESIIIYCISRKETVKIAEMLKMHDIKCGIYHGQMSTEDKTKNHRNFILGKVKIIAATIAFGMGINKSDVRVVIHYGSPKNLEGYYQEIGRASRDGEKGECYVFYDNHDFVVQEGFIRNSNNETMRHLQMQMLDRIKAYMCTTKCRRHLLLGYFDEEFIDKCNFCDNCCGTTTSINNAVKKTSQNIESEAKMLINLIESIKYSRFGIGMYINILRGSSAKTITTLMRKSKYYNKGNHRTVNWWKELGDHLIKKGLLKLYSVQGRFSMQVIGVTKEGLTWANMSDLNDIFDDIDIVKLDKVDMFTTI